ncbi:hypothetical protein [Leptospira noguchii]|nr:hypothetical protein [Leptospira noguchii]
MKFASCDDDPGNSVNAYLWVGVQGVVALSFYSLGFSYVELTLIIVDYK